MEQRYKNTYCNPTPLPNYPIGNRCVKKDLEYKCDYRETADPSVIYEDGVWYLYPSCGMVYYSSDFNVTPDNSVLDPIRARMRDASFGFCDGALTFPSDKPEIKIDYIFVSPDLEVTGACVPEIIASDHRVHVAEIK